MSEPRKRQRWKLPLLILLALLALAGGAAFSQKTALRTWYYAYRLERTAEAERQAWADRLVEMGEPAVPRLLGCFRKDDPQLCALARGCLEKLLGEWGPNDPRSAQTADRYFEAQPSFSPDGQIAALQLLPDLLNASGGETTAKARLVVSTALKDKTAELRYLGITVAAQVELNLLPAVVPLLDDPEAHVRQAAMTALGPIREGAAGAEHPLVESEELLRWLHDPDPEVRRICRMSLRSRGVSERDIRLGKVLKNPDPMERLKLLIDLPDEEDIDMAVWLKRLSNDADSAVRAGSARVAAEHEVDFAERLDQMLQTDPDGTVRKIAAHYRKRYR